MFGFNIQQSIHFLKPFLHSSTQILSVWGARPARPLCKNMLETSKHARMPSPLSLYSTFTTTSHHHPVVYTDMSSLLCNEFSICIPIIVILMISKFISSFYTPIIVIYSASKSTKMTHGIHPSKLQGNSNRLMASHAWISARWRSTWASEKCLFLGLAIMATVLIMTKSLKKKH